jgi:hypothetical protein
VWRSWRALGFTKPFKPSKECGLWFSLTLIRKYIMECTARDIDVRINRVDTAAVGRHFGKTLLLIGTNQKSQVFLNSDFSFSVRGLSSP